MPAKTKAHYAGDYQRRARALRAKANANPDTRCWVCNRTKAEHGRDWVAGHIVDGQIGGPLAPECDECNSKRGAVHGNQKRSESVSPRWR